MDQIFLSRSDKTFLKDKTILLRIDCDIDLREEDGKLVVDEDFRLRSALPTIQFLRQAGAKKIIILGHLGRPEGKKVLRLSLKPVADWFSKNVARCDLVFLSNLNLQQFGSFCLLENLRFDAGEELNDQNFARQLANLGNIFVNDAFGVSHREHASIVGLPKLLPSFLGLNFEKEMDTLSRIKKNSERPLVFVLGGSKTDKTGYIEFLSTWADKLLVGGKLPLLLKNSKFEIRNSKLILADLVENGRDINSQSIEKFKKIISKAATIVWAGPMGVYEEKESQKGTFEVAKAVGASLAFKVAAGGDTHRILSWLNLWEKFDFISVGGGAMLQFLRDGTLPGVEAIKNQ